MKRKGNSKASTPQKLVGIAVITVFAVFIVGIIGTLISAARTDRTV